MSENKTAVAKISIGSFYFYATSFFLFIFPIITALSYPDIMQTSDFLTSFYVAGKISHEGKLDLLYQNLQATSFLSSPFNSYAHQVLDKMPAHLLAVYMYPPTALPLFSWLSMCSPKIAFLLWQLLSIVSLALCAKIFASITNTKWTIYFWAFPFFLPIIQTIWIGQSGIIFGLLPLSIGFWCLIRNKPIFAGIAWSLLFLKPHFFPVAFLLMGASLLNGQYKAALSFVLSISLLFLATFFYSGTDLIQSWLHTLSLSDQIFSSNNYGYPKHLVASLPAAISQLLPNTAMQSAKWTFYIFAALISLHLLFKSYRLLKTQQEKNNPVVLSIIFIAGILLLPLISPHLLFYDLSIFACAGMLIYGLIALRSNKQLFRILILDWLFLDIYLLVIMFVIALSGMPLLAVAMLGWSYWHTLKSIDRLVV